MLAKLVLFWLFVQNTCIFYPVIVSYIQELWDSIQAAVKDQIKYSKVEACVFHTGKKE